MKRPKQMKKQKENQVELMPHLLLHWEEAMLRSFMLTSGKGDPEAKIARPPVHFWACSAEHSALEVGLDRGKMIGGLS